MNFCRLSDMNLIVIMIFTFSTSSITSMHQQTTQSIPASSFTLPYYVQQKVDVIREPHLAKIAQSILHAKGKKVEELMEGFSERVRNDTEQELEKREVNETMRKFYGDEFSRRFIQKLDVFQEVAVAEHYDEVKPFYQFVCAFHQIENTLNDAHQKGVESAKFLMREMNRTEMATKEETSPFNLISPSHLQFYKESSDYVVPGEKRNDVDMDYDNWRVFLVYKLNELAKKISNELESIREERTTKDIQAEFSFAMAKLLPYSHFVCHGVVPETRKIVRKKEEMNETIIFLEILPELMPKQKWYFPKEYLNYFNVLRRAFNLTQLETKEYNRNDSQSVIPGSEDCLKDSNFEHIYEYIDLHYSTSPEPPPDIGMVW